MKIIEKISAKANNFKNQHQPVIAFLGDSVTQGCFECYEKEKDRFETVFDQEEAYSNKVKKILSVLYPSANVNIINAGVSGTTAERGLANLDEEVLRFKPDLTVVCYGLNDAGLKEKGIERYESDLREIFRRCKESGSEVIFMTPNLYADRVVPQVMTGSFENAARDVVANSEWLDKYLCVAKRVVEEEKVVLCDCNKIWKQLKDNGADITMLLSNYVNHPKRELTWMFAYELVKVMLFS